MAISSHDVEAVVRDHYFFMDLVCLKRSRIVEETTYPEIHFSVHGRHDGANFKSVQHYIHKL